MSEIDELSLNNSKTLIKLKLLKLVVLYICKMILIAKELYNGFFMMW